MEILPNVIFRLNPGHSSYHEKNVDENKMPKKPIYYNRNRIKIIKKKKKKTRESNDYYNIISFLCTKNNNYVVMNNYVIIFDCITSRLDCVYYLN